MKLTYWELDWVHQRMKAYFIKYQEIYNELFDHITTAIEEQREAGDTGTLQVIFEQVVKQQFGGYLGIEEVSRSYEKGYKKKVRKMIWVNFRQYINFQSLLFTLTLIAISFFLPRNNKPTTLIIAIATCIAALFSSTYAYIKLKRLKNGYGMESLVYTQIISIANRPAMFLYLAIWLPQTRSLFDDSYKFKLSNVHPAILVFVLAVILIYDFSCIKLCRQELKSLVNTDPQS